MTSRKEVPSYKVKVNGQCCKVEEIRVSAIPFNRTWPGKQRDIGQSEIAYMVRIFDDGPVDIEIESSVDFKEVVVRPLSKKIKFMIKDSSIGFSIRKHGQYTVEVNGEPHALHLFYDPIRNFTEYGSATYHFGPGEHYPGLITVKSDDSIYIDKDAVVYGSVFGIGVKNVKIYGHGILNAGWEERREKHGDIGWDDETTFTPEAVHTYGGVRLYSCENIVMDGITICDPASYAVSMFDSSNIEIKYAKVVGLWKYNNDGIDFFNCENVHVKKCFVRSFDDSLCLKGITAFSERNMQDVVIEDCVFWCSWGKTCEIGVASACKEIKNIIFRNCDLIHNCHYCIDISDGQWAYVHDITYENINIEYSACKNKPVLQRSDEQRYEVSEQLHIPVLIKISDGRRDWQGHKSEDDPRCRIADIHFKNINVFMDEKIDKKPEILIQRCMSCSDITNILTESIFINGEKVE